MNKQLIRIELSEESIASAQKEIAKYSEWLKNKKEMLLKRLAEIGADKAKVLYQSVAPLYDSSTGSPEWSISVVKKSGENAYAIQANGKDVCFIEFGAGVTYGNSYKGTRPAGIVGIGEYGLGFGKNNVWYFLSKDGTEEVRTRGNRASSGLWQASEDIRINIEKIAKEVFGA